ncbi:hypothetical protein Hanom_Chr08g00684271 [Helianthus anomalus]
MVGEYTELLVLNCSETVKYEISNFTRIGAFLSGAASSAVILLGSLNSAFNMYS